MSNYTPTGNPVSQTRGIASVLRNEFALIQTPIASKGDVTGQVWTGTHDFSGAASVLVPTPVSATQAASKAYCDGLSFSPALPDQAGNAGKFVSTDGTNASWVAVDPSPFGTSNALAQVQAIALSF